MATKKAKKKAKTQTDESVTTETVTTETVTTETAMAKVEETAPMEITEAESLEIRAKIQELKAQIDSTYFDLAGLLYTTYDKALYKQWGFDTFKAYVEEELGFGQRKAQYLVGIADYFVNELADPEVIDKVKRLGWSKLKNLKDVITPENVDEWVKKAEEMNSLTLADAARAALNTEFDSDKKDEDVEVAKSISFKLFQEQFDNVQQALERAADLTNSTKTGHMLDAICTDYLAQNAFTSGGRAAIGEFFAKFEEQLGIRVFAYDPDKKKCLHGEDDNVRIVIVNMSEQEILCGEETLNALLEEVEEEEGEAETVAASPN